MKSMLYVGATLMIGASIYGFVDYKQTHNKKEFRDMYAEKKKTGPSVSPVTETVTVAEPEKPAVVSVPAKTVAAKKKAAVKTEVVDPVKPIAAEEKIETAVPELNPDPVMDPVPAKESSVVKSVKKKKIRKEFFSRGRMPEEEIVIEPVKKESKKAADKEQ